MIKNAIVKSTTLGREDHVISTIFLKRMVLNFYPFKKRF